jgi:hypothetical protein
VAPTAHIPDSVKALTDTGMNLIVGADNSQSMPSRVAQGLPQCPLLAALLVVPLGPTRRGAADPSS